MKSFVRTETGRPPSGGTANRAIVMDAERAFDTQSTPNPNSVKVTTRGRPFIVSGMESFRTAASAAGHPLAAALFEVDGVNDVFFVPTFVTVTKRPDVSWEAVWPGVEERIREFLAP